MLRQFCEEILTAITGHQTVMLAAPKFDFSKRVLYKGTCREHVLGLFWRFRVEKTNFPIEVPRELHHRFKDACRQSKTSMAREIRGFVEAKVATLRQTPVCPDATGVEVESTFSVISVQMPKSLRNDFRRFSHRHGLSMAEQVIDYLEKCSTEVEQKKPSRERDCQQAGHYEQFNIK